MSREDSLTIALLTGRSVTELEKAGYDIDALMAKHGGDAVSVANEILYY